MYTTARSSKSILSRVCLCAAVDSGITFRGRYFSKEGLVLQFFWYLVFRILVNVSFMLI